MSGETMTIINEMNGQLYYMYVFERRLFFNKATILIDVLNSLLEQSENSINNFINQLKSIASDFQ